MGEDSTESKKVTVQIRKIKIKNELMNLNRTFPKGDNIVVKGYVLQRQTIQRNGRIIFKPLGKVIRPAEGKKDDSGN